MPTPNSSTRTPREALLMVRYSTPALAFLQMYSGPRAYTERKGELPSRHLKALHRKHLISVCSLRRRAMPQTKREAQLT